VSATNAYPCHVAHDAEGAEQPQDHGDYDDDIQRARVSDRLASVTGPVRMIVFGI